VQVRFLAAEKSYFKGLATSRMRGLSPVDSLISSRKRFEQSRKLHHWEVNNLYELGNTYAQLQQFDRAIELYADALAANPGYDEIYTNLGLLTYRTDKQAGTRFLRISYLINPLSVQVLYGLSTSYLDDRDYARAADVFHKILKLDDKNILALTNLGYLASLRKSWAEAIAYYRAAGAVKDMPIIAYNIQAAEQHKVGMPITVSFTPQPPAGAA
jgi:tetratricopeptide (TPR) repeat protein